MNLNYFFLYTRELSWKLYFKLILRFAALGDRSSFMAKRQSRSRRRNCLHNYAPIKRAGYRRQERKGIRERRIGAEWLMRATAISIPAQLRCGWENLKKKRLARKEWNLIRSSCSLVPPGSHEEAKQCRRNWYVERDREKVRCRVEIIEPNNLRAVQREKDKW